MFKTVSKILLLNQLLKLIRINVARKERKMSNLQAEMSYYIGLQIIKKTEKREQMCKQKKKI